jgi:hypothetical protein
MRSEIAPGGGYAVDVATASEERQRQERIVTVFNAADALFVDGARTTPAVPLDDSSVRLSRVTFHHPRGKRVEHIVAYAPAAPTSLSDTTLLFSVQAAVSGGEATDHALVDVRRVVQTGDEHLELAESVVAHAAAVLTPKPPGNPHL